jgi:hypothetical protein
MHSQVYKAMDFELSYWKEYKRQKKENKNRVLSRDLEQLGWDWRMTKLIWRLNEDLILEDLTAFAQISDSGIL